MDQSHVFDRQRPAAQGRTVLAVADIWERVLGFSGYGIDEDFFAVGGDSIAAMQVVFEMERVFARELGAEIWQRHATIRGLATLVDPADPAASGSDLEERLRSLTGRWGGAPLHEGGLLRGRETGRPGRPWFWCLQEDGEAIQLTEFLGPSHPVYVMRSGHLLMSYTPAETAALARRYLREVLAADPHGPYFLGGVCQGSTIMLEMARQLQASGRTVALLALVDTGFWALFDRTPYHGKTVCLTGARSRYNPWRQFRVPDAGLRKVLPAGVRLIALPGDHDELFGGAAGRLMAAALTDAVSWAAEPSAPGGQAAMLPRAAYQARIVAPAVAPLLPGEARTVQVQVGNASPVAWPAGAGLALGNHWLSRTGEVLTWRDGRVDLPHGLAPGEDTTLPITVRAPAQPGCYMIEFDLVEEGVTWFKDRRANAAYAEVTVAPRSRLGWLRIRKA